MTITEQKRQIIQEIVPCKVCGWDCAYPETRKCFDCRTTEIYIERLIERDREKAADFLSKILNQIGGVNEERPVDGDVLGTGNMGEPEGRGAGKRKSSVIRSLLGKD